MWETGTLGNVILKFQCVTFLKANFPKLSPTIAISLKTAVGGTKWLATVNICSLEGDSAHIFVSKMSPAILVIKVK